MTKLKIGEWEIEEAELDQQHIEAQQRGQAQQQTEPQAQHVLYDQESKRLVIELKSGVTVLMPSHLLQGLDQATAEELASIQLGPRGASLHWETLGVSFSLANLIIGIFGTNAWMQEIGRRGGSVISATKSAAARANGKRGGRPPKTTRQEAITP